MTIPAIENRIRRAPGKRPVFKLIDVHSAALGAVGNVSVELEHRSYRVVLNCGSSHDASHTMTHGSGNGAITQTPIQSEEVTS